MQYLHLPATQFLNLKVTSTASLLVVYYSPLGLTLGWYAVDPVRGPYWSDSGNHTEFEDEINSHLLVIAFRSLHTFYPPLGLSDGLVVDVGRVDID